MQIFSDLYNSYDMDACKILNDFLPDKIFDAHMHVFDKSFSPNVPFDEKLVTVEDYHNFMSPLFGKERSVRLNVIPFPDATMTNLENGNLKACDAFIRNELSKNVQNVGEMVVMPSETEEDLEKRLIGAKIKGFKCYHVYSNAEVTWNCNIGEYLPISAWEVANARKLCITLHMVKDRALADKENLNYIENMAKRYPDAVLILAHAARSFASWTGIEYVEKLAHLENVWFDFSAVCESPAMFQIMRKCGVSRCMWGSDFPVNTMRGKAISLSDTFYWISGEDIGNFSSKTAMHSWLVSTENLMAVRQACILAELSRGEIEDLFYNNAARLFK